MNDKQQKFADRYLQHFNATRAAKEAGYSFETAYSIGHENLRKPEINAYIKQQLNTITATLHLSRELLMAEAQKIAFCEMEPGNIRLKAIELLLQQFNEKPVDADTTGVRARIDDLLERYRQRKSGGPV